MPDLLDRRRAFGAAVRERRRLLHLSQQQLATRAGIDRKTVTRVETAVGTLTMERMWRLADALDLDARELLRREPEAREP